MLFDHDLDEIVMAVLSEFVYEELPLVIRLKLSYDQLQVKKCCKNTLSLQMMSMAAHRRRYDLLDKTYVLLRQELHEVWQHSYFWFFDSMMSSLKQD